MHQLFFNADTRSRGIGDKYNFTTALTVCLQGLDSVRQRFDAIMHTAPQVHEKRVILVGNFGKIGNDTGHCAGLENRFTVLLQDCGQNSILL